MGPPPPVDPRILRTHAGNLELLGYRIELVGHLSADAALRENVFGDLCAPVAVLIEDRHRDQDELTGRFPVNLENATRKLHRMADGKRNGNRERRADYWSSAGRTRSRKAAADDTGSRPGGGAGDFDALVAKFRERTWLDDRLAARGAVPPSAAPVRSGDGVNPAAPLADPLRSLIDRMDVDREAAAAAARRWALIAAELREIAADLEWTIEADLKGWQGPDHLAYQHLMARNVNGIAAVAASAAVLGHAVESTGWRPSAAKPSHGPRSGSSAWSGPRSASGRSCSSTCGPWRGAWRTCGRCWACGGREHDSHRSRRLHGMRPAPPRDRALV
jgi:hypothetical protein